VGGNLGISDPDARTNKTKGSRLGASCNISAPKKKKNTKTNKQLGGGQKGKTYFKVREISTGRTKLEKSGAGVEKTWKLN